MWSGLLLFLAFLYMRCFFRVLFFMPWVIHGWCCFRLVVREGMCFTMDDVRWSLIFSQFSSMDVSERDSKKVLTEVEASSIIFDQLALAKTNVLGGFFLEYAGMVSLATSIAASCGCLQNRSVILSKLSHTSVVLCWRKQLTKCQIP